MSGKLPRYRIILAALALTVALAAAGPAANTRWERTFQLIRGYPIGN